MAKRKLKREYSFSTKCVHSATKPDVETGAVVTPIYANSTFAFESVEQGANRFMGKEEGYIYTRLGNPTIRALERKISALEGAEDARAFGSGMAAVTAAVLSNVKAGEHIVSSDQLYGATHELFYQILSQLGIEVSFVNTARIESVHKCFKENTKLIFVETPANPTLKLSDIKAISDIANAVGVPLVVDNSFMSPFNQRPLELGADLVVESLGKYLSGHLDSLGGLVAGSKEAIQRVYHILVNMGGILSPFDAWLILRGVKSLPFRMKQHNNNALRVAKFLEEHGMIEKVNYPGLKSHPQHALAKKQMYGFGNMMSFEVRGGYNAGRKLMDSVKLCTLAVSFGGDRTLIQHPASMTHTMVHREMRLKTGVTDGLARLSVGIEDVEDILDDLEQALNAIL